MLLPNDAWRGGRRPSRAPEASRPLLPPPSPLPWHGHSGASRGPDLMDTGLRGKASGLGFGAGDPGLAPPPRWSKPLTRADASLGEQSRQTLHLVEGVEVVGVLVQAVHAVLVLRQRRVRRGRSPHRPSAQPSRGSPLRLGWAAPRASSTASPRGPFRDVSREYNTRRDVPQEVAFVCFFFIRLDFLAFSLRARATAGKGAANCSHLDFKFIYLF